MPSQRTTDPPGTWLAERISAAESYKQSADRPRGRASYGLPIRSGTPQTTGQPLVFQVMATAHGYAALTGGGINPGTMPLTVNETVSRTADAVRALIVGNHALGR